MIDREKIIEALEACVLKDPDDSRDCRHCPRCNYGAFITNSCINGVMADCLSMLKDQDPRVMTLEEARNAEVVWVEDRSTTEIYPCIVKNNMNDSKLYKYGAQWRCWTSRPTDEQRKAAKWDD